MEKRKPKHTGVPTFFRVRCWEASQGGNRSYWGYWGAGYHLAMHVEEQMPDDAEPDEWEEILDELRESAADDDTDAVWRWFQDYYPECMKLVPTAAGTEFVEGVRAAWEEGRL